MKNEQKIIADTLDVVVDMDDNFHLVFNIKQEEPTSIKMTKKQATKAIVAMTKLLGDL